MRNTRHGWRPDTPDFRDYLFAEHASKPVAALPPAVSLRSKMPPVFDQGQLGSCTGNAGALAFAFEHGGGPYSRLFIYYDERVIENTVKTDSGAELRDCVKALASKGVCLEHTWPYNIKKFKNKPVKKAYTEASTKLISQYTRLVGRNDFHQCLAQGFPFICGFSVYESFESEETAKTGIVKMPQKSEQMVGGHAVTIIGYDTNFHKNPVFIRSGLSASDVSNDMYEVQNSWGPDWGDAGRFWIPAAYIEDTNLCDDCWTIRK